MNTEVCCPGPPVWTTRTPGTERRASARLRYWRVSISAALITVTELPSCSPGVGMRVAVTTICSAVRLSSACRGRAGSAPNSAGKTQKGDRVLSGITCSGTGCAARAAAGVIGVGQDGRIGTGDVREAATPTP